MSFIPGSNKDSTLSLNIDTAIALSILDIVFSVIIIIHQIVCNTQILSSHTIFEFMHVALCNGSFLKYYFVLNVVWTRFFEYTQNSLLIIVLMRYSHTIHPFRVIFFTIFIL